MMETEEALDVVTLTDVVATIEDLNGRLWEPLSRIEGALDGSKTSIGEARAVEEGIELRLKTTADELGKLLGAYNRLADRF